MASKQQKMSNLEKKQWALSIGIVLMVIFACIPFADFFIGYDGNFNTFAAVLVVVVPYVLVYVPVCRFMEISENRKLQRQAHDAQKQLASLSCIDKYSEACNRVIAHAATLVEDSETLARANRNQLFTQADTTDWAIAGGIAEGIAGPAAGIAVALDTQRQNEEAELRAAQARQDAWDNRSLFSSLTSRSKTYLQNLTNLKGEIITWINGHISESNESNRLFEALTIKTDDPRIDDSGILHVNVYAYFSPLQEGVNNKTKNESLVLDGSLRITVKRNGKIVGDGFYSTSTATFEEAFRNTQNHPMFDVGRVQKDLFPLANIGDWFNGFSDNPEGACSDVILVPLKADKFSRKEEYTIEIEPYKLWVIKKD